MTRDERYRKSAARKRFDGSARLFNACWREMLWFEHNSDSMDGDCEIDAFLDNAASRRVNDSRSSFYIYGR
jgi:hypothetical protein